MMAVASDKIKEKREKVLAIAKGSSGEPMVTEQNYKLDLCKALSYYNAFEDNKTRRSWAIKYFKKHGMLKELSIVESNIPDYHFLQVGSICRLLDRGQYISKQDQDRIFSKLFLIIPKKEEKTEKQPLVDRTELITDQVIGDINGEIDNFITNKITSFSVSDYFKINNVTTVVKKNVVTHFSKLSQELSELDGDEQLSEGYSNFSRREMRKFRELIDNIISSCSQQKATRKPRKVKEKPVATQVKGVKCLAKTIIGNIELTGDMPANLIGAKEVWTYNVKYNSIQVYRSDIGMKVRGTKLIDFSIDNSFSKKVKKPELFLNTSLAKASLKDAFTKLTTKENAPGDRLSENVIILKAFK